jgi:hypothetical protein
MRQISLQLGTRVVLHIGILHYNASSLKQPLAPLLITGSSLLIPAQFVSH